jgi:hypothetical protein
MRSIIVRWHFKFWGFFVRLFYKRKLIKSLNKISTSEWARIHCLLNSRKVPPELESVIPSWYDTRTWYDKYAGRSLGIFSIYSPYIHNIIGDYEVSRYWNVEYRTDPNKMTNESHRDWWLNKRY